MQHVGGDDQVELLHAEVLGFRVLLDIQNLAANERITRERMFRFCSEQRTDVGEQVVAAAGIQPIQDERRGAAGTAADLENSQSAAFRQIFRSLQNGLRDQRIQQPRSG